jgi:signal transduction histidine kinase
MRALRALLVVLLATQLVLLAATPASAQVTDTVFADGLIAFLIAGAAWAASSEDLLIRGYPLSWLFVVAYAGRLRWTLLASVLLAAFYAYLHGLLNLGAVRTVGSIQFVVIGLIAGWAFDSLREREGLRLEAEERLGIEQQAAARKDERVRIARKLHDSVLQTLHVIRMDADDPAQVRYLARKQE